MHSFLYIEWAFKSLNLKSAIKQKRFEIYYFFFCEVQLFRVKMEYNFIHMADGAGLKVPYSI